MGAQRFEVRERGGTRRQSTTTLWGGAILSIVVRAGARLPCGAADRAAGAHAMRCGRHGLFHETVRAIGGPGGCRRVRSRSWLDRQGIGGVRRRPGRRAAASDPDSPSQAVCADALRVAAPRSPSSWPTITPSCAPACAAARARRRLRGRRRGRRRRRGPPHALGHKPTSSCSTSTCPAAQPRSTRSRGSPQASPDTQGRRPDHAGRAGVRAPGAQRRRRAATSSRRRPTTSSSTPSGAPPTARPISTRASARSWPPPSRRSPRGRRTTSPSARSRCCG